MRASRSSRFKLKSWSELAKSKYSWDYGLAMLILFMWTNPGPWYTKGHIRKRGAIKAQKMLWSWYKKRPVSNVQYVRTYITADDIKDIVLE